MKKSKSLKQVSKTTRPKSLPKHQRGSASTSPTQTQSKSRSRSVKKRRTQSPQDTDGIFEKIDYVPSKSMSRMKLRSANPLAANQLHSEGRFKPKITSAKTPNQRLSMIKIRSQENTVKLNNQRPKKSNIKVFNGYTINPNNAADPVHFNNYMNSGTSGGLMTQTGYFKH